MQGSIDEVQWLKYRNNDLCLELGSEVRLEGTFRADVLNVSTIPKQKLVHL